MLRSLQGNASTIALYATEAATDTIDYVITEQSGLTVSR
jgi:hypothetical protein